MGFWGFSLESFIPLHHTACREIICVFSLSSFQAGDMGGFDWDPNPIQGIHTAEGHSQHPPALYSRVKKREGKKERESSSILILLP